MKIAFDHQAFCLQYHGGISRYVVELVKNLPRRSGVETTVIAPVHLNEYLRSRGVRERLRGSYLPLKFRGGGRIASVLNSAFIPLFWRGQEFDVIHETYYSKAARGRGRVRILTIHDLIHEQFPQDFPDSTRVIAAKRAAAERADHIICVSENTRRDAVRMLGVKPERTSVIHLGCSFAAQEPAPRSTLNPYVLYVGQRRGYKNFKVVLEAFASSDIVGRGVNLVAFGGGAFSEHEKQHIARLGLATRARQVSGNDSLLRAYYRAAIALVYPSRYEGFGIPPLEAMANGCPVVCSNAGSLPEVVGNAGAFFDPDNADELRGILERLAQHSQYAQDLRVRGFEHVHKYSWEKCAAETLEVYERVAASRAASQ